MMIRSGLFSGLLFFLAGYSHGQTMHNNSFVHDGKNRVFSYYVPASYSSGQPVPLIIGLHGTGSSGAEFAQHRDFGPIADTANFIVAYPDGTKLFGISFWNFGNVFGSTVDDVGFIEAMIDSISSHYSIDQNRIYSVGMSNGGFMSYYLACQTNRFAAVGAVTGSMSNSMYANCNPQNPTPVIHVHGTNDPINPYGGNSTSKSIQDVIMFWANQNGCDTNPVLTSVPNTNTTDGVVAERYLYPNGISGNTVEHFKVIGGEHTWPGCPMPNSSDVVCMDFDARMEIWRFFNQYELDNTASIKETDPNGFLDLYPNPTKGFVYIQAKNYTVGRVVLLDMQGRIVEKHTGRNIRKINLGHLKLGAYIIEISGEGFCINKKIIVSSN